MEAFGGRYRKGVNSKVSANSFNDRNDLPRYAANFRSQGGAAKPDRVMVDRGRRFRAIPTCKTTPQFQLSPSRSWRLQYDWKRSPLSQDTCKRSCCTKQPWLGFGPAWRSQRPTNAGSNLEQSMRQASRKLWRMSVQIPPQNILSLTRTCLSQTGTNSFLRCYGGHFDGGDRGKVGQSRKEGGSHGGTEKDREVEGERPPF